jgi:lipopolysaccharide transport system ATP-binding protein
LRRVEVERKFVEIISFAGIETFNDTPLKRYSSGMYVRLAFAVAAHLEPDVLVIDEVLAVGDADFQKRCMGKMSEVAREGRTVILVSHNMAAVRNLCDRGILLLAGQIAYDGDVASAVSRHIAIDTAQSGEDLSGQQRPKWARPLISSARLLASDGSPGHGMEQGGNLRLSMQFCHPEGEPIRSPVMGVVIKDAEGEVVGGVNTRMTGTQFTQIEPGLHDFICEIIAPPLQQGDYLVDFWLGDGSENIDVVENALRFHVVDSDIYSSGIAPFARLGRIYFLPQWRLTPSIPGRIA